MANHNNVLKIAQELKDKSIEARAYAGLGHAARCTGDIVQAKMWHEKQLDMALNTKDKVAEGRACSNLGMYLITRSAHQTPNFTNPEFQFPQFKLLQSVFFFFV